MTVAAIDIGTLSTRLLASTEHGVVRRVVVTRLGEGLVDGGNLSDAAIERVERALASFSDVTGNVDHIRVVATAAARRAGNVEALAASVRTAVGAELSVIEPAAEAELAFAGAVSRSTGDGPVVVVDIGGGSTEFSIGSAGDGLLGAISLETGALRVTEEFLESDPPRPAELSSALSVIEVHLADLRRELPLAASALESGCQVIGVGGTITTAAAVEIGLVDYDREQVDRFVLERAAAEDVFRTLATEPFEDRQHNPGLHPDRVASIIGGLCILVETMRQFDLASITVSEADLLDGLLAEAEGLR